jgi:hypothetical protein
VTSLDPALGADPDQADMIVGEVKENELRRALEAATTLRATPWDVFEYLDDHGRLAAHMERQSLMVGGMVSSTLRRIGTQTAALPEALAPSPIPAAVSA